MSFQQFSLHPQVLAGIKSVGFTKPTPIQQQAIPVAMEGRDVLGLAQTGTGKTAAFALPILPRLVSTPHKRGIRALVIAPTRELAEQIHQSFIELGQHLPVKSVTIYGGVGKGPQLAGLRRGAQVVVACPGRLLDHVNEGDIDLSGVEVLVLDESDTMCDMGFLPDVRRILGHVAATWCDFLPRSKARLRARCLVRVKTRIRPVAVCSKRASSRFFLSFSGTG